jgi:recombination protein RecA
MRAHLESLLRARKLDVTLTTAAPWRSVDRAADEDRLPTGVPSLDRALGGGLRRGHLSDIIGPRSAGRTAVLCGVLAMAAARGEAVALVDTHDRFDPVSAAAAGLDLSRLLWIRDTGDASRALKALNLVLQAGGFGVVALDLADASAPALRAFPFTTWLRVARVIEGSQTVALLTGTERIARSPGGVTIALDVPGAGLQANWAGGSKRARVLRTLELRPRVVGGVPEKPTPNSQFPTSKAPI